MQVELLTLHNPSLQNGESYVFILTDFHHLLEVAGIVVRVGDRALNKTKVVY